MSSGEARKALGQRVPASASERPIVVMIVEDQPLIGTALEDAFKDFGHTVIGPVSTCAAALELLKVLSPDVALLDTELEDGTCVEVARDLRQRSIPFLIHSGMSSLGEDALEFADVPWIEKPSPFDEILGVVTELVEGNAKHA